MNVICDSVGTLGCAETFGRNIQRNGEVMGNQDIDVKDLLQDWYRANVTNKTRNKLSWKNLEKKTGVSASYLTRIASGKANPSFNCERDLLPEIYRGDPENIRIYLSEKYPSKFTKINDLVVKTNTKKTFFKSAFDQVLYDLNLYRIFRLTNKEYKDQEIEEITGHGSGVRLNTLRKMGIVEHGETTRRTDECKEIVNSSMPRIFHTFRNNLEIMEQSHKESLIDENVEFNATHNKLIGIYENMTEDMLEKFIEKAVDLANEIRSEAAVVDSNKTVPTFVNITIGRFDNE